jgi:hypothetical protein
LTGAAGSFDVNVTSTIAMPYWDPYTIKTMKLLAFLVATAAAALAQYATFADAERRLTDLARSNPSVMTLESIGTSAAGRKVHAVRIAAPGATPPDARPAVFVGANLVGYHNAGTQAALGLIDRLLATKDATRTYYILPMLNPDAHDSYFGKVKWRNSLNGAKLDRDRDGLTGEDGPNDLNADGRITQIRIADPNGGFLPNPADPRVMKPVDPLKGEKGNYRIYTEGVDDDRDGQYGEDPNGGFRPDKNFAHAWADDDPESGPFPGSEPEARAVMDFLLAHRNIAVAFVFGPANNLLSPPRGVGASLEVGQIRVTPPGPIAGALGLEAGRNYSIDEAFALLKDSPAAQQATGGVTRENLATLLGAGPVTAPAAEDLRYYDTLALDYKRALDKAGLDSKRDGQQSQAGGLQNWLYYHYGAMVIELDIWGVPKRTGAGVSDTMAYIDKEVPQAFVAWAPVTLPDGTRAEVGGVDPFVEIAPPAAELAKAVAAHAEFVQEVANKLGSVKILGTEAAELSPGVWRVRAIAGNTGFLPTHTQHAVRARTWLPIRLNLVLSSGTSLVSGKLQAAGERLVGGSGQLKGEWLVKANKGAKLGVSLESQNAGSDRQEITLQ